MKRLPWKKEKNTYYMKKLTKLDNKQISNDIYWNSIF